MQVDLTQPNEVHAKAMDQWELKDLLKGDLLTQAGHKIDVSNDSNSGYLSAMVYLLQEKLSGSFNVCGNATDSCREICLGTNSGHAVMKKTGNQTNVVQIARMRKTKLMQRFRKQFFLKLIKEIELFCKKAQRKGLVPAFRFNGTSDLAFHTFRMPDSNTTIIEYFNKRYGLVAYDYTKNYNKMVTFLKGEMPVGYHLTFSYTPEKHDEAKAILSFGGNIAVAFDEKLKKDKMPSYVGGRFLGHPIIFGDEHDFRFLDKQGGYVVGLSRKGRAVSTKGFFVSLDNVEKGV